MDGLMVDSEPLWWSVERALAEAHGLVWTDEMAGLCIGTGLPNVITTMQELLGLELAVDEGVGWLVETFVSRVAELELKPGCLELIDAAAEAGLPVAVASSSTRRLIDVVLGHFGLTDCFSAIVSGDSVPAAKPAPDIFLRAAKLLDLPPDRCVVLEDSLAGVTAAQAGSIPVIAVPEQDRAPFERLTDHVVTDLHQARSLLGL
jgi:HAD superfamily hydrolase (TIGR01509 family)